jgi:hypothetical protein
VWRYLPPNKGTARSDPLLPEVDFIWKGWLFFCNTTIDGYLISNTFIHPLPFIVFDNLERKQQLRRRHRRWPPFLLFYSECVPPPRRGAEPKTILKIQSWLGCKTVRSEGNTLRWRWIIVFYTILVHSPYKLNIRIPTSGYAAPFPPIIQQKHCSSVLARSDAPDAWGTTLPSDLFDIERTEQQWPSNLEK